MYINSSYSRFFSKASLYKQQANSYELKYPTNILWQTEWRTYGRTTPILYPSALAGDKKRWYVLLVTWPPGDWWHLKWWCSTPIYPRRLGQCILDDAYLYCPLMTRQIEICARVMRVNLYISLWHNNRGIIVFEGSYCVFVCYRTEVCSGNRKANTVSYYFFH